MKTILNKIKELLCRGDNKKAFDYEDEHAKWVFDRDFYPEWK